MGSRWSNHESDAPPYRNIGFRFSKPSVTSKDVKVNYTIRFTAEFDDMKDACDFKHKLNTLPRIFNMQMLNQNGDIFKLSIDVEGKDMHGALDNLLQEYLGPLCRMTYYDTCGMCHSLSVKNLIITLHEQEKQIVGSAIEKQTSNKDIGCFK
ncbi:hypothetical protein TetV_226 [Tetraselmis virus 1]|uniref:Uncharacterized protein n=1 Tax=Tetraselmis virus 1 TaxID=2060617 RepID=A0A2P0VN34_9VIRU|nr:hypothetical protein QJ968_gp226 [Tetraselmis virus 1]AUF82318.1 hypothetical protein TetV_226 [Tetraselmis virus 1]